MNEEPIGEEPQEFEEFEEPAPAATVEKVGILQRVTGMFFEPGKTLQSLKTHPNWLVVFLITGIFVGAVVIVHTIRVPFEVRAQKQQELAMRAMERVITDEAQLQQARERFQQQLERGEAVWQKLTGAGWAIAVIFLITLLVATLYFVGVIIGGKRLTFKQALGVRVYADLPPTITQCVLLIILMYLKPVDEIDPLNSGAVLTSSLGFLFDPKEQIVLATIANNIDLFQIWSLALAIIGLSIVPDKMKRGPAIGVVVVVWLLGLLVKLGWNLFAGSAFM
jgi:hypothetical protein